MLLTATASVAIDPAGAASAWLEITLNGALVGDELGVCDDQRCWLPRAALSGWRIDIPAGIRSVHVDGADLVSLAELPGIAWRFDLAGQRVALTVAAAAFAGSVRDLGATALPCLDAAIPGSFLNYSIQHSRAAGDSRSSAHLEWGLFGRAGAFTTTAILSSGNGYERLDSTWLIEQPERLASIRLGDSITDGGQWGRARRFAGVQWGNNFALRPDLVTFPLPAASGSSAVPATVDIYVDQVLRSRTEVPAGPFEFNNLPVTTGSGEVDMVVRDAYGREQHVRLDYFVSPQLLTPGLRAFEYNFGLQRSGLGESTRYRDPIAVVTERIGISDRLTAEWHSEITADQVRSGLGAVTLAHGGLYALSVAGSTSAHGSGWLASVGYEWRGDSLFGSAGASFASTGFDAASPAAERSARRRLHAALGWSLPIGGSIAVSYLRQDRFEDEPFEFASLGYQFALGRLGHVQLSAARTLSPFEDTALSLHYALPLGDGGNASVEWMRQDDAAAERLQLQRSAPPLGGFGYRFALEPGATRLDLGISARRQHGEYTVELARFMSEVSYRAEIAGGLAWIGGELYAGQRSSESFAVVIVDDFPDVGIYADHRLVARTDERGRALIPGLRAWQRNRIGIEQGDLPFEAHVDALEMTVTPPARSGLQVDFPVRREHSAQLRIVFEDELAIPATAVVEDFDSGAPVVLGLDGLVLLAGVRPGDLALRVRWRSRECRVPVRIPAEIPPGLDLGTHRCAGIER